MSLWQNSEKETSMKKGAIIGISVGVGVAVLITAIVILAISLSGFSPRNGGFIITENNYSQFTSSCSLDATMSNKMNYGNARRTTEIKPYKTKYYTEDGYPIWAVGATWEGVNGHSDVTYLCYLGSNSETAYLIELKIDGETVKRYADVRIVDEKGQDTSLTN